MGPPARAREGATRRTTQEQSTASNLGLDIDFDQDDPPQPIDPPSQAEATIIDGSNQLFSMYIETTTRHDLEVAENWERDADSAIIVNGFFSVMVAILLTRSYNGLKLNSQDASAFYLSQIYRLSAGLNGTSTPLPFEVPTPSTFSPDPSSVRASALWSLSLVISLACTVIATLLRQWARRYLHLTQEQRGPGKRARIRELTAQGVERLRLQWMSLVLPGFFHLSVLLFLYGLFHYSNNNVVDLVVLSSALIWLGLYLFTSIISCFPFGSICHTPLSSFAWSWSSRALWLTYKMLYNFSIRLRFIGVRTRLHLFESARSHLGRAFRGPGVDMEDLARKRSSFLDTSVVLRMFDSLDGHQDMEQFLSAIPGFYNSSWVKRDVPVLEKLNGKRLAPAIRNFHGPLPVV
ncbi:hypothetical protein H4582DRAFT_1481961 [Lactarius indigo]|nr:hypothetical protein H4582DRAFT_1481961 [Lactarius indigo]